MRSALRLSLVALLAAAIAVPAAAAPIGTAFTYQGYLVDNGTAATGLYDLRFSLWDDPSAGSQVGGTLTLEDQPVVDGVFNVELDFGVLALYYAQARWLLVEVRPGASTGSFSALPRQHLTPSLSALGLALPVSQETSANGSLLQFRNSSTQAGSAAGEFNAAGSYGVIGRTSSTGSQSAGVHGEATATSGTTIGVEGIGTASPSGTGIVGKGTATGGFFQANGLAGTGVYAYGTYEALYAENTAIGPAIYAKGKGKSRADAVLRVENTETDQGMCAYFVNSSNFATAHLLNNGTGQLLWLDSEGGGDYIVATGPQGNKFWVDNAGVTHTKVLEILGGADLSERFDTGGGADAALEPGTVVCIDPDHEGRLEASATAYDRRVAGIVSGAGGVKPGMLMGQHGSAADGAQPVALSGRVYCRVTAANGPVRPGDLLTTSDVPGLAMRVTDFDRAHGATLGKAMGTLERGEGLVLVLVGLQ
jgi:hypothetical protein